MEVKVDLKDKSYSVFIQSLPDLSFDNKVAVITNQKIAGLHLNTLLSKLNAHEVYVITIPDGEQYKNFQSIELILEQLFVSKLDRKSLIISLGGGVISDMSGFVAGIFQRGINFVNIPTTLLSMVDASVGGKTGINNKFGKNLIGVFHQPKAVYCDKEFLKTLPKREISAGIAEAIKMAVMFDKDFFEFFLNQNPQDIDFDKIIEKCVKIKADVVSKDEKESGIRAVLNYGHTFAHVIENQTNYTEFLHGEAVSIGINMANHLALELGLLSFDEVELIKKLLERFNLPVKWKIHNPQSFYEAFFLDKKSSNNKIKFILPNKIGNFVIKDDIDKNTILKVLDAFSK